MKRSIDPIVREAKRLTKRNKRRFNRKYRRTRAQGGTGKGGYRKNGECMALHTMA